MDPDGKAIQLRRTWDEATPIRAVSSHTAKDARPSAGGVHPAATTPVFRASVDSGDGVWDAEIRGSRNLHEFETLRSAARDISDVLEGSCAREHVLKRLARAYQTLASRAEAIARADREGWGAPGGRDPRGYGREHHRCANGSGSNGVARCERGDGSDICGDDETEPSVARTGRPRRDMSDRPAATVALADPGARSKRYDTCYRCGEEGHWANECPTKSGRTSAAVPFGQNRPPKKFKLVGS